MLVYELHSQGSERRSFWSKLLYYSIGNSAFPWDAGRIRLPLESLGCTLVLSWMSEKSRMFPFPSFKKLAMLTAISAD